MDINKEMKQYYDKRANEYDYWYNREGSYNKGENLNSLWFLDIEILKDYALNIKNSNIIEIAAGTGMWTQHLMKNNRITPTDTSEQMLRNNFLKTNLKGKILDAFNIEHSSLVDFNTCFFGFWLSHISINLVDTFFESLKRGLSKSSRVIIFDSYFNKNELNCISFENLVQKRVLRSGKVYNVYKKYYTKEELELIGNKFFEQFEIKTTPNYFYIFDGILKS